MELITTNAHTDGKIGTDFSAYRFQNLEAKAHSVFKAASPFIIPFIDSWTPKLVDQVLVNRRQLNTVQSPPLLPGEQPQHNHQ